VPTRAAAPVGSPCWADLWTSDVEGSRRFYSELFGWEAQEPSPEFGGYFMWTRDGVPLAGGMGPMPDMPASDSWKIYLAVQDIEATASAAAAAGAEIAAPAMAVADLGSQLALTDPTGAAIGAWQAGTFPGFTVLNEQSSPSWFELHTRDFSGAVAFYESVFGWKTSLIGDTDEFRYATMTNPAGGDDLAGIMDAATWLPEGEPATWSVYWEIDDIDTTVARVSELGGGVTADAQDTPYGRLAAVTDPSGAVFKLRTVKH
jgi:predicted enzyme related to lactoylglutathione lyase